jgi:hypothetical protein
MKKKNDEKKEPAETLSKQLYSKLSDDERIYFETRVDDQINWYDNKSLEHQDKFKSMKMIIIVSSASIPFLVTLKIENFGIKIVVGLLGIAITVMESLINMNKHSENWIEYRSICETLKHEKFMYLYKTGVYRDDTNRFEYFVERVESIISQENINWASLIKNEGENKDGK